LCTLGFNRRLHLHRIASHILIIILSEFTDGDNYLSSPLRMWKTAFYRNEKIRTYAPIARNLVFTKIPVVIGK